MSNYDPRDWHWVLPDDAGKAWSSRHLQWVQEWPADRETRIANLVELRDVLRQYAIRGPVVTPDDIRHEAQRRIILLCGANDLASCLVKQLNATMRAVELTAILASGASWTGEQAAEAGQLRALADGIKALRCVSNVLELNPPADYTADEYWS